MMIGNRLYKDLSTAKSCDGWLEEWLKATTPCAPPLTWRRPRRLYNEPKEKNQKQKREKEEKKWIQNCKM